MANTLSPGLAVSSSVIGVSVGATGVRIIVDLLITKKNPTPEIPHTCSFDCGGTVGRTALVPMKRGSIEQNARRHTSTTCSHGAR